MIWIGDDEVYSEDRSMILILYWIKHEVMGVCKLVLYSQSVSE